jgi:hypothetical protein
MNNMVIAAARLAEAENRFNNCTMEAPEFLDAAIHEYTAALHQVDGALLEGKGQARAHEVTEDVRRSLIT